MEGEALALLVIGALVIGPIGILLDRATFGEDSWGKTEDARRNRNRRQTRRKAVKRAEERGYEVYEEQTSHGQYRRQAKDRYRG